MFTKVAKDKVSERMSKKEQKKKIQKKERNRKGADESGSIAERSRASNTLDRGRGPEFESP